MTAKIKTREARLIPKCIDLRVVENRISIKYKVEDTTSGTHVCDTWINFTPSKELMDALEKEIELAIKNYKIT